MPRGRGGVRAERIHRARQTERTEGTGAAVRQGSPPPPERDAEPTEDAEKDEKGTENKSAGTPPAPTAGNAPAPLPEGALPLHGAIRDTKNCSVCHEPHASAKERLVRSKLGEACGTCHDKEIILTSPRRIIPNVKRELEEGKFSHKPVAEGKCEECHGGHGKRYRMLLKDTYPPGLYRVFDKKDYGLCFECHDSRLATEGRTVRTGFRDGDRNLHYLHIQDEDPAAKKETKEGPQLRRVVKKGRTCTMCHAPHAGIQAKQVRPTVTYGPGGWKLEILFERTGTGGSCVVACHKDKSYDNTDPPAPPKETKDADD